MDDPSFGLTDIEASIFPLGTHGTIEAIKREWYAAGRASVAESGWTINGRPVEVIGGRLVEPGHTTCAHHVGLTPGLWCGGCNDALAADAADPGGLREESVDDVARTLMAEWERVEGKPVSPSYVATFADMARAVLATHSAAETCPYCPPVDAVQALVEDRARIDVAEATISLALADAISVNVIARGSAVDSTPPAVKYVAELVLLRLTEADLLGTQDSTTTSTEGDTP